jgi:hypothetical protein
MMVIVVDSILVARRGSDGLDATKQAVGREHTESVVHSLARDCPDIELGDGDDFVGCHVGSTRHCPKHGEALCRCLKAALA